jgi:hypothetical protein
MVLSAGPTGYIVSGLPTPSRATTGRRPLTPRTTTQVRLFKQLLDKQTGALLALPLAGLHCRRQKAQLLQHVHGILLEPFFDDFASCKAEDVQVNLQL